MSLEAATRNALPTLGRAVRSIDRPWPVQFGDCTVRVLVHPWPVNFGERLAILRTLEQHGSFEVFREESREKPEFIGVVRSKATVDVLYQRNPLLLHVPALRDIRDQNNLSARPDPLQDLQEQEALPPDQADPDLPKPGMKQFKIEVYPSSHWKHATASERNPFIRPWPKRALERPSFATSVLKQTVPQGLTTSALAYWDVSHMQWWTRRSEDRKLLDKFTPLRMRARRADEDKGDFHFVEEDGAEILHEATLQRQGGFTYRGPATHRSGTRGYQEETQRREKESRRKRKSRYESVEEEGDDLAKAMRASRLDA